MAELKSIGNRELLLSGCIKAFMAAILTIFITQSAFAQSEFVYTNAVYGWSISYPAKWTLDPSDPSFVRILSPDNGGLCGVHTGPVPFRTVHEFTNFMLAHSAQAFQRRGLEVAISSRQQIVLPGGITGIDVLAEIIPGGRSRRIFVLTNGNGLLVDCEAYGVNWHKLETAFGRIMRSLALREQN